LGAIWQILVLLLLRSYSISTGNLDDIQLAQVAELQAEAIAHNIVALVEG
jgi:hypothetical protein